MKMRDPVVIQETWRWLTWAQKSAPYVLSALGIGGASGLVAMLAGWLDATRGVPLAIACAALSVIWYAVRLDPGLRWLASLPARDFIRVELDSTEIKKDGSATVMLVIRNVGPYTLEISNLFVDAFALGTSDKMLCLEPTCEAQPGKPCLRTFRTARGAWCKDALWIDNPDVGFNYVLRTGEAVPALATLTRREHPVD